MSRFSFHRVSLVFVGLLAATVASALADDWPQWRGPKGDGVWRETGIIEKFVGPQLPIRWRQPIGPGYSGPTVAAGRVFVTDRQTTPAQVERVHCFDERQGTKRWSFEYDCVYKGVGYEAGPRACVTIDGERAFALGSMGHLHCLEVTTGSVLWKRDLNADYQIDMPIWGITAAPMVFEDTVIVHIGGEGACIVALDKASGKEKWKSLSDRGQYSAPLLVQQAGQPVVVCWTGDSVAGLNARSGALLWRHPFKPKNMPIGVATPVLHGDRLFLTSFYDGSLMLRLKQDQPGVEVVWQRVGPSERQTDALQSIISTPVFDGQHVYGVDSYGELRCLDAKNGDRVWENLTATPKDRWSTIHFVRNGDRDWLFNERGELIIAKLAPDGFHEISRTKLLEPTTDQLPRRGGVCWSHPAFANRHVFARNDKEIVCASLEAK